MVKTVIRHGVCKWRVLVKQFTYSHNVIVTLLDTAFLSYLGALQSFETVHISFHFCYCIPRFGPLPTIILFWYSG